MSIVSSIVCFLTSKMDCGTWYIQKIGISRRSDAIWIPMWAPIIELRFPTLWYGNLWD